VIELEPGLLVFKSVSTLDGDFARKLGEVLRERTGSHWQVRVGDGEARPSLKDIVEAKSADNDARIRDLPVVKAALAAFPDAKLEPSDDNRHRSNP
jgi:DNA polymerase-3 subunit gamma/tau